jgi:hypothetical protein
MHSGGHPFARHAEKLVAKLWIILGEPGKANALTRVVHALLVGGHDGAPSHADGDIFRRCLNCLNLFCRVRRSRVCVRRARLWRLVRFTGAGGGAVGCGGMYFCENRASGVTRDIYGVTVCRWRGYSGWVTGSPSTGGVEMPQCPICKSEAEEIDLGLFDGAGFSCETHGEFKVAASVFAESKERTRLQWENALAMAKRRAAPGDRPLITLFDFPNDF